jgi:hypothetical protein
MTALSPLLLFRVKETERIHIQRQAPPLPDLRETATPCSPLGDVRSADRYKLDLNAIIGDWTETSTNRHPVKNFLATS